MSRKVMSGARKPKFESDIERRFYDKELLNYFSKTKLKESEISRLITEYQENGCLRSRDKVAKHFGHYVIAIAKYNQDKGVSLFDMINEGMLGLYNAMETFDTKKGNKFITYCGLFINHKIRELVDIDRYPVKVPKNVRTEITKCKEIISKLELRGNDEENLLEPLLKEVGANDSNLGKLLEARFIEYYSHPSLFRSNNYSTKVTTNDEDDETETQQEIIQTQFAETNTAPDHKLEEQDMIDDIKRVFDKHLTAKEEEVLILFFGLGTGDPIDSIKEVAWRLGINPEHARKTKERALAKLRSEDVKSLLIKYLNN